MSSIKSFFSTLEIKSVLQDLIFRYQNPSKENENSGIFTETLISMLSAGEEWDRFCQYSIRRYGAAFQSALNDLRISHTSDNLDLVKAFTYVFVVEVDLTTTGPLEESLGKYKDDIAKNFRNREDRAGSLVKTGTEQLGISILKNSLNSPGVGNFKEVGELSSVIEKRIAGWVERLDTYERKVVELKDALEKQQHAYNFVGLYQGFSEMEKTIKDELTAQRKNLLRFGLLMLLPALVDLILMFFKKLDFSAAHLPSLIGGAVVSLTCTLIFLYFFRIVLREADSKEAQLVQVRLRMTLCQFIQHYATYASDIKQKNPDALSKFENLIFSGIVGTQDKLPSTFDGIEQLGALFKSVKG